MSRPMTKTECIEELKGPDPRRWIRLHGETPLMAACRLLAEPEATSTTRVLGEVLAERERQNEKWGEQNQPSLDQTLLNREGGCTPGRMCEEYEIPTALRAKYLCDTRHKNGEGTFAHILVEEVCESIEAGCESEARLREELVQVAAVAVQWIEAIDRRKAAGEAV